MRTHAPPVRDLDHVVMPDGRIYRVVGNLGHPAKFVGRNVCSPDFTEVSSARQGRQYERYRRVFRNENNSTEHPNYTDHAVLAGEPPYSLGGCREALCGSWL